MNRTAEETRRDVDIVEKRILSSLATESGVSEATIFNWVPPYSEECQTNDEKKIQLELMEKLRKIWQKDAEQNYKVKSNGTSMAKNQI